MPTIQSQDGLTTIFYDDENDLYRFGYVPIYDSAGRIVGITEANARATAEGRRTQRNVQRALAAKAKQRWLYRYGPRRPIQKLYSWQQKPGVASKKQGAMTFEEKKYWKDFYNQQERFREITYRRELARERRIKYAQKRKADWQKKNELRERRLRNQFRWKKRWMLNYCVGG